MGDIEENIKGYLEAKKECAEECLNKDEVLADLRGEIEKAGKIHNESLLDGSANLAIYWGARKDQSKGLAKKWGCDLG